MLSYIFKYTQSTIVIVYVEWTFIVTSLDLECFKSNFYMTFTFSIIVALNIFQTLYLRSSCALFFKLCHYKVNLVRFSYVIQNDNPCRSINLLRHGNNAIPGMFDFISEKTLSTAHI